MASPQQPEPSKPKLTLSELRASALASKKGKSALVKGSSASSSSLLPPPTTPQPTLSSLQPQPTQPPQPSVNVGDDTTESNDE